MRALALAALLAAAVLAGGCARTQGPGYYWQSLSGHADLMWRARPVGDWLADARTPEALRTRLALAQRLRAFAVQELALPQNASYQRYAELDRAAAVYNVVAAPELSLTLQTWCFPVAGCVGYRGYYREADARAFAASLDPALEVGVYPVPAYSTLGWLNWAGGDPLLSSFIRYPEGELARLLFHELAHQLLYAKDDTRFNESFATAVERIGVQRWLDRHATAAVRAEYQAFEQRRRAFRALTAQVRERLQDVYTDASLDAAAKRAHKAQAMADFRQAYAALRQSAGGFAAYDAWVARANNALLGAQGAYDGLVPAFEALYEHEGRDLPRFYDAVRTLAELPPAERQARLQALAPTR